MRRQTLIQTVTCTQGYPLRRTNRVHSRTSHHPHTDYVRRDDRGTARKKYIVERVDRTGEWDCCSSPALLLRAGRPTRWVNLSVS